MDFYFLSFLFSILLLVFELFDTLNQSIIRKINPLKSRLNIEGRQQLNQPNISSKLCIQKDLHNIILIQTLNFAKQLEIESIVYWLLNL